MYIHIYKSSWRSHAVISLTEIQAVHMWITFTHSWKFNRLRWFMSYGNLFRQMATHLAVTRTSLYTATRKWNEQFDRQNRRACECITLAPKSTEALCGLNYSRNVYQLQSKMGNVRLASSVYISGPNYPLDDLGLLCNVMTAGYCVGMVVGYIPWQPANW